MKEDGKAGSRGKDQTAQGKGKYHAERACQPRRRFADVYSSTRTGIEKSYRGISRHICSGLNITLAEFFAEDRSRNVAAGKMLDSLNETQKRLLDEFLSSL